MKRKRKGIGILLNINDNNNKRIKAFDCTMLTKWMHAVYLTLIAAIACTSAHERNTSDRTKYTGISHVTGKKRRSQKCLPFYFRTNFWICYTETQHIKEPHSEFRQRPQSVTHSLPPLLFLFRALFRWLTLPVPCTILYQNQNQINCSRVNATNRRTPSSYFAWFWPRFLRLCHI